MVSSPSIIIAAEGKCWRLIPVDSKRSKLSSRCSPYVNLSKRVFWIADMGGKRPINWKIEIILSWNFD
jgi:hypothetical protein